MSDVIFDPQSKVCVVCGSPQLVKYDAQAHDMSKPSVVNIVECGSCNFAWQYPFGRNNEQSIQFFKESYSDAGKTTAAYFDPERKRKIAKLEFDFVTQLPTKGKTLLDIGAGAGFFAEIAADNGWSVTAVDPALDVNRICLNKNINPIRGTIQNIPKGELFDVVTLWDVIEHSINPAELLANAMQYIREGGWLVIETGNFKSVERVKHGIKHWIYQLDHRWYFSPGSFEWLAKILGFTEFIFLEKVLRPEWQGKKNYSGSPLRFLLKSIILQPLQLPLHLPKYRELHKAKSWEMPGICIFTVASRKR